MNAVTRPALALLSGALLLSAGCRNQPPEYTEADGVVPQGVSVEPTDEPYATGGVSLPGNVTVDTAPVAPPPGAPDTAPGTAGTPP